MARVLIIEDDPVTSTYVTAILKKNGHDSLVAVNGQQGLSMVESELPDLLLVDLGLPDTTGLAVTKKLREWSKIPIIVLTANEQESMKVAALDAGADDYITKPFGVPELMARIRVALRRLTQNLGEDNPIFNFGNVEVNLLRRQVTLQGQPVHLTPTEYKFLLALVRRAGQVVTHRQLLQEVWGPAYSKESHYLRVYMKGLREKLENEPATPRYLLNEPGVGYRLMTEQDGTPHTA